MRKPPNPGAFVLLRCEGRWAGLVEDRGAEAVGGRCGVLIRFSGCDLGFGPVMVVVVVWVVGVCGLGFGGIPRV